MCPPIPAVSPAFTVFYILHMGDFFCFYRMLRKSLYFKVIGVIFFCHAVWLSTTVFYRHIFLSLNTIRNNWEFNTNLGGGYLFILYFFKEFIPIYLSFKHFILIWTNILFIYKQAKKLVIDVNKNVYIKIKCLKNKYGKKKKKTDAIL